MRWFAVPSLLVILALTAACGADTSSGPSAAPSQASTGAASASPSGSASAVGGSPSTSAGPFTQAQLVAVAKATYFKVDDPQGGPVQGGDCSSLQTGTSASTTYAKCPFTPEFRARLLSAVQTEVGGRYALLCQCQQFGYAPSSYVATSTASGGTVTVLVPRTPDGKDIQVFVLSIVNRGGVPLVDEITASCGGTLSRSVTDTTACK